MSRNITNFGAVSADVAYYPYVYDGSGLPITMNNISQYAFVESVAPTDVLVLPEARPGRQLVVYSGDNGISLQTLDPDNVGINGGVGPAVVSAIPPNTLVSLFSPKDDNYIATGVDDTAGAVVIPPAS